MNKHKFNENEKEKYREYAKSKAPKSKLFRDCICAFIIGGLICTLGEGIGCLAAKLGVNEDNIKILIPCALVVISSILTALGIYQKIAKFAGAGTIVPITGFSNAITSVSIDSTAEGFILGVGAKMFTIAGPVILYGTAVSVVVGLVYWILSVM